VLTLQSTAEEATAFIRERDADVKNLNRMPKGLLVHVYAERGSLTQERELVRWSKDELIQSAVYVRYPAEQLELAYHIRYQAAGIECSDACQYHGCRDDHLTGTSCQTYAEHAAASVEATAQASK